MYIAAASAFPNSFYIATIALFAILTPPTFFVWRKHGIRGFLGYNFVWSVCAIKIVGSALSLADANNTGMAIAATILNSMTISPLILASLGVFHEARKARCVKCRDGHDRLFVTLVHCLVFAGLALIIVAIVQSVEGSATSTDSSLVDVGLALLVVSWAIISAATLYSLRSSTIGMFPSGVKLLYAVLLSLPFIGVRLVYGILALLLRNPAFAQSLAARVILGLIPEFSTVAIFVVAGFITRDIWREEKAESVGSRSPQPREFREVYHSYPKPSNPGDLRRQEADRDSYRFKGTRFPVKPVQSEPQGRQGTPF